MNRKDRRAAHKHDPRGAAAAPAADADALFASAVMQHQVGRNDIAADLIGQAVARDPGRPDFHYALGVVLDAAGRTDAAVAPYGEAIRLRPDYAEAHTNLGNALLRLGRLQEAATCYENVLALKPDYAEMHCNLGNVLAQQGRAEQAVAAFERALQFKPSLVEARNGLGITLIALGRDDEAAEALQQALALNPNLAEAHMNLGNIFRQRGDLDAAVQRYEQALARRPDLAEAHNNLGLLRVGQGRPDDALAHYQQAIAAKPDFIEAYNNLARVCLTERQIGPALDVLQQALAIRETPETKTLFVECIKGLASLPDTEGLEALVLRALSEPWGRPSELANPAAILIKRDAVVGAAVRRANAAWPVRPSAAELLGAGGLAALADNRLLMCVLETARIADIEIERFLTALRHALLELAVAMPAEAGPKVLAVAGALARQCFINDYVFARTADERAQAESLLADVAAAMANNTPVGALQVAAVAAYGPLGALSGVESLLDKPWPDSVAALLTQQVREPREERDIAAKIAHLTPIDDEVSRKVRDQYEENPYPRWVKGPPGGRPINVDAYLRGTFPRAPFRPLARTGELDVLIAGCGTGQHPIEIAQRFESARVLAVDLSLASLAYASRKTGELGLANIEYAQADLTRLGTLERTFDVVEAAGVLHHLADPFEGWRVLLSKLKPGGVMFTALYSETARADIVAVRDFIARRGYKPTADGISRCRQELLGFPDGTPQRAVTQSPDFYTTSDCRDLLFHAQEQRLRLPQIEEFLRANDLTLLGFEIAPHVRKDYAAAYPDDVAMADLGHWHEFETAHPRTFIGMYQFWVQKAGA
jgi:tetratricopeptide (TPR) repeat protein/2-polyprenyl-3-methyl-5-hydroxy-6-metoxy-1,4-benzoquinol methylase